jgi:hypothetical protein
MEFTIASTVGHPPEAVQDALLDPDFVAATGTLPKVGGGEVLELTRDDRRARLRVRYRFTAPLSGAVTRVVDPNKLTWVDDATFDLAGLRSDHVLIPDSYVDRLASRFSSVLEPDGTGTRWTVAGTLTVNAPIVGGRIASVIVDGLREHATAQAVLLDEWLSGRG